MGMKEVDDKLPSLKFMRVHRSFIVGLNYIQSFEKGRIVLKKTEIGEGTTIPIGESYKDAVQSLIKK
jgi:DNA-binding LytR/AlgR family response regulator